MYARPVSVLLAMSVWSAALCAADLDDPTLRSELVKLVDTDSQIRQSAIASLTASRDGRLASVLDAYRLGRLGLWVREAVYGLQFDAPGGPKQMHADNQHTHKPVYIGEILPNGQFRVVYETAGLVVPESYSSYLHPDGNIPAPTGGPK